MKSYKSAIPNNHNNDDIIISDLCACVCDCVVIMCCICVCLALIVVGSWPGGVATPQSTKNPRPRDPETSRRNQQVNSEEAAPTEEEGTRRPHVHLKVTNLSVGLEQSHRVPLTRDPPSPKAEPTPRVSSWQLALF